MNRCYHCRHFCETDNDIGNCHLHQCRTHKLFTCESFVAVWNPDQGMSPASKAAWVGVLAALAVVFWAALAIWMIF